MIVNALHKFFNVSQFEENTLNVITVTEDPEITF